MLRERVITAVVLLALLAAVLGSGSELAFQLTLAAFFGAACWESLRLLNVKPAVPLAVACAAGLALLLASLPGNDWAPLAALCVLLWALRFVPALKVGLPPATGLRGGLFAVIYLFALLGCFVAIEALFRRSGTFLVSVMAIVWVADIGAYFSGRAFGRRKLAPAISPGKSWEGALGGWFAVLLLAAASTLDPIFADTFAVQLQRQGGWGLWLLLMTLVVAASVVGDLFESLMKRRAGMKDSSNLLPGHGGVLDRIDALIPVMPLALLIGAYFR